TTLSDDGGIEFRGSYLVSLGDSSDSDPSIDAVAGNFGYGDYTHISFVDGMIQPIWADNSVKLDAVPDPRNFDLANARIAVAEVNRTPLEVEGKNLQGTQGKELTDALVATFVDPEGGTTAENFTATIDWGDGTDPDDGKITQEADGSFTVTGTHAYLKYGTFTVTTSIEGHRTSGEATSTATIENAPLDLKATDDLRVVRETEFTETV